MTPPEDLRRQVLAAVERMRARFDPALVCSTARLVGAHDALDAILAEFALNPDGTMKEPPA